MRGLAVLAALAVSGAMLSGCAAKLPEGVDGEALTQAVGRAIGSPSTCVVIGDANGKIVWRGGGYVTCSRNLPPCDGGGAVTAEAVMKASIGKPSRFASCPSPTGGVNTVGWAIGPVPAGEGKPKHDLTYVAVMEGERALPGREVQDRVENAFAKAGF